MNSRNKSRTPLVISIAIYALLLIGMIVGMNIVRQRTIRSFSSAAALDDWQEWRDETRRQATSDGPVQRREADSSEPPAAVLMREHFLACLAILLLISSVIYWTFALLLLGSIRQPDKKH